MLHFLHSVRYVTGGGHLSERVVEWYYPVISCTVTRLLPLYHTLPHTLSVLSFNCTQNGWEYKLNIYCQTGWECMGIAAMEKWEWE